jgi:hypothetical protein
MICRQTMEICPTPNMCRPFGGCQPVQPVQVGWKCPVCGKGNAPFAPTCGNSMCGVDLTRPAC